MISVIVATHNRRHLLERTLAAFERQDWPPEDMELLVVDNGSTDGTAQWLAARLAAGAWPQVRLLHESRPGKSHAVNRGVAHATGSLLLFTDDDVVPDTGWVGAMARAMEESGADFGVGRVLPLWEAPPPAWLSPALYGVLAIPDNGPVRLRVAPGCNEHVMPIGANMALRASVIARIGGWRAELGKLRNTLRSGEDHEFFLRMLSARLEGVYEPSASVGHLVPADRLTRGYFRRWMRDNGRVVAALNRRYPQQVPALLGVPRYLWGEALRDATRALSPATAADPRQRFAVAVRLAWFAGYLRGAWFPNSLIAEQAPAPQVARRKPARLYLEQ